MFKVKVTQMVIHMYYPVVVLFIIMPTLHHTRDTGVQYNDLCCLEH